MFVSALPTYTDGSDLYDRSNEASGFSGSEIRLPLTRRFIFSGEIAIARIADASVAPEWRALREAGGNDVVRVAVAVAASVDIDAIKRARVAVSRFGLQLDVQPILPNEATISSRNARRVHDALLLALDAWQKAGVDVGLVLRLSMYAELQRSLLALRAETFGVRAAAVCGTARAAAQTWVGARQGRRDLLDLAHELAHRGVDVCALVPPQRAARRAFWQESVQGCVLVDDDGAPLFRHQAARCARDDDGDDASALTLWAARHRTHADAVVVAPCFTLPAQRMRTALAQDVRAMYALDFADVGVDACDALVWDENGVVRFDVEETVRAACGALVVSPAQAELHYLSDGLRDGVEGELEGGVPSARSTLESGQLSGP